MRIPAPGPMRCGSSLTTSRSRSRWSRHVSDQVVKAHIQQLVRDGSPMQAARAATAPIRQPYPPRRPHEADHDQRQAEQRRGPMRHGAGAELPGRHLELAAHGARIAGDQVMHVVRHDRGAPPAEIRQPQAHRPEPARPPVARGLVVGETVGASEFGKRLAYGARRGHAHAAFPRDRMPWPGAAISIARAVTGLMPGRGGRLAGTFTFQASPSHCSSCTKFHPRSIWPG
jgi:hypothetical protein